MTFYTYLCTLKCKRVMKRIQRNVVLLMLLATVFSVAKGQVRGDIDDDGKVTVSDITALINEYLSGTGEPQTLKPCRRMALLDMTNLNKEDETSKRNVYSADYMLEVAGVPNFRTQYLGEATEGADMILLSSEVKKGSFSVSQLDSLIRWVEAGGVLVASCLSDPNGERKEKLRQLFGVASVTKGKTRYTLNWSADHFADKELEYIDEEEERVVSLGRGKKRLGESIMTCGYALADSTTAEVLARYDTGENAVVRHRLGRGTAYLFGFQWRDVIQRSQLNKDFEAQRIYSNAFEPSADVVPLFVRSVFAKHRKVGVWKFTIPDGYESLIIPTHDCDSRTSYDSMYYISQYERALDLKSHFFLTVHYFRDAGYLSDFYDDVTKEKARLLLADGHTVGSHSICHFPDFSVTDRFPLTVVTQDEYAAQAHHENDSTSTGTTTGGSTWAEVVLSKQIIENDLQNHAVDTPGIVKIYEV